MKNTGKPGPEGISERTEKLLPVWLLFKKGFSLNKEPVFIYEVMLSECHHGQEEEYSKTWYNWLWGSSAACDICKGETARSKHASEIL